jgi:hypothetical protein
LTWQKLENLDRKKKTFYGSWHHGKSTASMTWQRTLVEIRGEHSRKQESTASMTWQRTLAGFITFLWQFTSCVCKVCRVATKHGTDLAISLNSSRLRSFPILIRFFW